MDLPSSLWSQARDLPSTGSKLSPAYAPPETPQQGWRTPGAPSTGKGATGQQVKQICLSCFPPHSLISLPSSKICRLGLLHEPLPPLTSVPSSVPGYLGHCLFPHRSVDDGSLCLFDVPFQEQPEMAEEPRGPRPPVSCMAPQLVGKRHLSVQKGALPPCAV